MRVRANREPYVRLALHVHVSIDDDGELARPERGRAPQRVQHATGLVRRVLPNADEENVTAPTGERPVPIDDLGDQPLYERQEESVESERHPRRFVRRTTRDDDGQDRIGTMCDGRHLNDRQLFGKRVVAGVTRDGRCHLRGGGMIDVTLDDDLGTGGNVEFH